MNLRNYPGEYNIGLDMGTGSVGWAVTDADGKLLHFKKQPTWGSRLFGSASTAAEARAHRGQRRRYVRRRWRLDLLQQIFQAEMDKVDPEFFIRLRQSRLLPEDRAAGHRDYAHPFFNGSDFTEGDYYANFPTIYHLRKYLMEADVPADLRLVYLALHNIVKHRGNFLRQGQRITARTASPADALHKLAQELGEWCESRGYADPTIDEAGILAVLEDEQMSPSGKKKAIAGLIDVAVDDDAKANKNCREAIAGAVVGLKAKFGQIFGEVPGEETAGYLSSEEFVDAMRQALPDDSIGVFDALCSVYSAYLLVGMLSYAPGQTISANMVGKYDQYHEDLRLLKDLVREYAPGRYDGFFRGPVYEGTSSYDAQKAKGYTSYNLGVQHLGYDDFRKQVKALFDGTGAQEDSRYQDMMQAFENGRYLRRLKTSDNGSIYYQLHLEELQSIIRNQGRFHPFLLENAGKLESLVTFRIPYYVGPLSTGNAALDKNGNRRFAWAQHKPGREGDAVLPWNWDEVIDTDRAAESFIMRMTGTCTYLQGEDVLPKCSLLYEEFCVLNELNGLKVTEDGDKFRRLDAAEREGIVHDLFRRKRRVRYRDIEDWLRREEGSSHVHVSGGQGETGLESNLGSYLFFCKDVFHVDSLDSAWYPEIEKIILWNTLFEDRDILKRKLLGEYGVESDGAPFTLSAEQVRVICKKRLAGWGRLSRRFLAGIRVDTECGPKSIMDVLREGDPNSGRRRGRAMVLMEALHDDALGFQARIDEINRAYFAEHGRSLAVSDLPGSPAIRRSINQALRIVDEVSGIAGKAPANIFVEVTRDEDPNRKGRRTNRRYNALLEATMRFKEEYAQAFDPEVLKELKRHEKDREIDERLMLYFAQHGKCLYTGKPIDITRLSTGDYEVDHIIPRTYIKDDSLENKALVLREANQRKTDALLIDPAIRRKMRGTWGMLFQAGLIGKKKYRNLLRDRILEEDMKGFINRQLVETSQMVKLVQALLEARYPGMKVVPVKASMSHNLRERAGFVKCREVNDYHHAHDAYLACRVGLFIQKRHPEVYEQPIALSRMIAAYVRKQSEEFRRSHKMPGSAGFIVESFMSSGFDRETGEVFRDDWDAEAEVAGIRRALNCRQCHISRMPFEDTGTYWDATIYSPRAGKNLALPLKRGLDVGKYGSYSREQFAYFFIYEARKPGKGKRLFRFAQVPVSVAAKMGRGMDALEDHAKALAAEEGLEYVRIERPRILKYQLVEIDGDRMLITGKSEVRNGTEIAFTMDEVRVLSRLRDGELLSEYDDAVAEGIWHRLAHEASAYGKRLAKQLNLMRYDAAFSKLDSAQRGRLLLGLIALYNAQTNVVDTSPVGGTKHAGSMHLSHGKLLEDPKVSYCIIDQSVTGMFERRCRVGL